MKPGTRRLSDSGRDPLGLPGEAMHDINLKKRIVGLTFTLKDELRAIRAEIALTGALAGEGQLSGIAHELGFVPGARSGRLRGGHTGSRMWMLVVLPSRVGVGRVGGKGKTHTKDGAEKGSTLHGWESYVRRGQQATGMLSFFAAQFTSAP